MPNCATSSTASGGRSDVGRRTPEAGSTRERQLIAFGRAGFGAAHSDLGAAPACEGRRAVRSPRTTTRPTGRRRRNRRWSSTVGVVLNTCVLNEVAPTYAPRAPCWFPTAYSAWTCPVPVMPCFGARPSCTAPIRAAGSGSVSTRWRGCARDAVALAAQPYDSFRTGRVRVRGPPGDRFGAGRTGVGRPGSAERSGGWPGHVGRRSAEGAGSVRGAFEVDSTDTLVTVSFLPVRRGCVR